MLKLQTAFLLTVIGLLVIGSADSQQMEKRSSLLYRQQTFEASFPTVGQQAPDIELKTIDGQPAQLSEYLGKPLVLIKGSYT